MVYQIFLLDNSPRRLIRVQELLRQQLQVRLQPQPRLQLRQVRLQQLQVRLQRQHWRPLLRLQRHHLPVAKLKIFPNQLLRMLTTIRFGFVFLQNHQVLIAAEWFLATESLLRQRLLPKSYLAFLLILGVVVIQIVQTQVLGVGTNFGTQLEMGM